MSSIDSNTTADRHESTGRRPFEAPRIEHMGTVSSRTGMFSASGMNVSTWGFDRDPVPKK